MTRFQRSQRRPKKLRIEGSQRTQQDIAAYTAGTLSFKADSSIYGHYTVKNTLSRMQNNRCAYCETNVKPAHPGNVDHFRPCGGVKQADGAPQMTPGYFWLAYQWDNLLLACTTCNTSRKRQLFPLAQPHLRARVPGVDDEAAGPLFINPANENPRDHLRYREESAYPIGGSVRGRAMLKFFKLNQNRILIEDRRQYLELFKLTVLVAEDSERCECPRAEALLRQMLGGAAKYYAMICDAFRMMVDTGIVARLANLRPPG